MRRSIHLRMRSASTGSRRPRRRARISRTTTPSQDDHADAQRYEPRQSELAPGAASQRWTVAATAVVRATTGRIRAATIATTTETIAIGCVRLAGLAISVEGVTANAGHRNASGTTAVRSGSTDTSRVTCCIQRTPRRFRRCLRRCRRHFPSSCGRPRTNRRLEGSFNNTSRQRHNNPSHRCRSRSGSRCRSNRYLLRLIHRCWSALRCRSRSVAQRRCSWFHPARRCRPGNSDRARSSNSSHLRACSQRHTEPRRCHMPARPVRAHRASLALR